MVDLEGLTQEEKDLIKSFVENRNSKKVYIINKARGDRKIYIEFFGLTYIAYIDGEFAFVQMPCGND